MAVFFAACGTEDSSSFPTPLGDGGIDGTPTDDGPDPFNNDGGLVDPDGAALTIKPTDATLTVFYGQPLPSLTYQAFYNGNPVTAAFTIDRGELGDLNATTGLFVPKGAIGGKGNVTASYQGKQVTTSITIMINWVQDGDPDAGADAGGSGGNGGVGGEGPGAPVSSGTITVLNGAPTADPGLAWLYPYDATVWPRGILAPLLQWKPGAQSYDAVYIHLSETSFDYKGYFAKTATPFIHHPIPQAAWKALAYSNDGKEDVTVDLVFEKGGVAYGPITEKWKIAKGTLKGTVYYNSYGTNLAKNYCCAQNASKFGGATLAIRGDSTSPTLVAGNDTNCRVCHSVSADGSVLVTQNGGNYSQSMNVDLKNNNAETAIAPADARFGWPGIAPDGKSLFSNGAPLAGGTAAYASALYALPGGAAIATTGLPAGLRAGTPAFSPDGKHVAFNYWQGPAGDQKSLAYMDFGANTFGALNVLHTPQAGKDWWPSFLPTNDALVYQLETVYNGRDQAGTRSSCDSSGGCSNDGTHAQLYFVDLKTKTVVRMDKANGLGHVPVGPNGHADDTTLNYEPTVNPVPSGGYAWVVFTSRRLYGNVATINPFWSDPRFHDISTQPTTKKLWVAAIDLNAPAGTDPSHPSFYLPAQELLAGNSRGFWVVDPCKSDGNSCETGDECCNGYCQGGGDAGTLVCTNIPPKCAQEFEKCTTDLDCCGGSGLTCINNRCGSKGPT